jgi:hypothetical protein
MTSASWAESCLKGIRYAYERCVLELGSFRSVVCSSRDRRGDFEGGDRVEGRKLGKGNSKLSCGNTEDMALSEGAQDKSWEREGREYKGDSEKGEVRGGRGPREGRGWGEIGAREKKAFQFWESLFKSHASRRS